MGRDERGSAMLLAILATAVLGAGLMVAFAMSGTERRMVMNQEARTDAWRMAQSALERFASDRASFGFRSSPAAAYESTRVRLTGGYADVVLQRLRPSVDGAPAIYLLRSTGYATGPQLTATPVARRSVAQLATWSSGGMRVPSALTSLSGITKQGNNGTISGYDACGTAPAAAGVAVPDAPGYSQSGRKSAPTGDPDILTYRSSDEAAAAVTLDWNGIVNDSIITPDYSLPHDWWPSFSDPDKWPVIRVDGDFTLPGDGQGILIVTGSLKIKNNSWRGLLLVGDDLTTQSRASVVGAAYTGLNVKLGRHPDATALKGNNTFQYNSCDVASALANFGGLTMLPNAWVDNWAGW